MMKKRKRGAGLQDKNSMVYRRKIKTNDANLQNDDPKSQTCRARRGAEGEAPRRMQEVKEKGCLKGRLGFAFREGRNKTVNFIFYVAI